MSADQGMTEAPLQPMQGEQFSREAGNDDAGGFAGDDDGGSQGAGQSKSSRRRRRKRKGKADGVGASEGGSGEVIQSMNATATPSGDGQAAPAAQAPPVGGGRQNGQVRSFNGGGQSQPAGQNAPGGTKRWKKKFRDRERPRGENVGGFAQNGGQNGNQNGSQNGQLGMQGSAQPYGGGFGQGSGNNGGGFRGPDTHQPGNNAFKRKGGGGGGFGGKQRSGGGARGGGFVGPMDHSYRAANGNVFDPAASTVDHGGGNRGGGRSFHSADSQPIDYSQGRVIPIKEGTPTHIYFFIEDLFFTAKISETARKLGVKIAFIKNEKEQIAALTSGEDSDRPGLIVFDLNNASAKPLTLIPKLKTKLKKTTSIIGFLSHLQGDLKAKAVEAGCDTVMPRAAFSQNLPNLLRRYGLEEVEETNYNQ